MKIDNSIGPKPIFNIPQVCAIFPNNCDEKAGKVVAVTCDTNRVCSGVQVPTKFLNRENLIVSPPRQQNGTAYSASLHPHQQEAGLANVQASHENTFPPTGDERLRVCVKGNLEASGSLA